MPRSELVRACFFFKCLGVVLALFLFPDVLEQFLDEASTVHFLPILATCALAGTSLARDLNHVRQADAYRFPEPINRRMPKASETGSAPAQYSKPIVTQNKNTTKFEVDGKKIPDVDFDIGESYAGMLPISEQKNVSELYFWYFREYFWRRMWRWR